MNLSAFYFLCLSILTLVMTLFLYRVVKGPSLFDRLIGLNGISTKAVILLALIGALYHRLDMFLDLAIGYGLLNLVGSLAVGKYLERKGQDA